MKKYFIVILVSILLPFLVLAGTFQQVISGQVVYPPNAPLNFKGYTITWTANGDGIVDPGEFFNISVRVKNEGSENASNVNLTLIGDATPIKNSVFFSSIVPGQEVQPIFSFRAPYTKNAMIFILIKRWTETNGSYSFGDVFFIPISGVSTCYNGIMDGDETGIDCGGSCPKCRPDLSVTDLSIYSIAGGRLNITTMIKNIRIDANAVDVKFVDSYQGTVVKSATVSVGKMLAGESRNVSITWDLMGGHVVYVFVDPDDRIDESDELNNVLSKEYRGVSVYVDVKFLHSPDEFVKKYIEEKLAGKGYSIAATAGDANIEILVGGPLAIPKVRELNDYVTLPIWGWKDEKGTLLTGGEYTQSYDGLIGTIPQQEIEREWGNAPQEYRKNFVLIYGIGYDGTLAAAREFLNSLGTPNDPLQNIKESNVIHTGGDEGPAILVYLNSKGEPWPNPYSNETAKAVLDAKEFISGRVANEDNQSLKFMKVELYNQGDLTPVQTTFTDENGDYVFLLDKINQTVRVRAVLEFSPTRSANDVLFRFYNDSEWDAGKTHTFYIEKEVGV